MKLSHIHETGMSRRNFLRRSGGGLASLLVAGGLPPQVASTIASPNPPKLMVTIISNSVGRNEQNPADSLKGVGAAYNTLRKLLGRNADISVARGDLWAQQLQVSSYISPEDVAKLLKSSETLPAGKSVTDHSYSAEDSEFNEAGVYIEIAQPDAHKFGGEPWVQPDILVTSVDNEVAYIPPPGDPIKPKDLIKTWWDNWEKFGTGYLDKNTFSLLRKNGIDPIRPNIHGGLPDVLEPNDITNLTKERGYNDPDAREMATGSSEPEEWEGVEPEKPEKPEKFEKPHDYGVASPMHQWVENKSRFEAELDRVLSLN